MKKTELITAVADKMGMKKSDADKVVNAVIDTITDALKAGDKVQLIGFGTFETRKRAGRTVTPPKAEGPITIEPSTTVSFKAGKALRDTVNE